MVGGAIHSELYIKTFFFKLSLKRNSQHKTLLRLDSDAAKKIPFKAHKCLNQI